MILDYTVDRTAAMRIKTSDDDGTGGNERTILHEISFDFGVAREFADLASKDNENLASPGLRTFTLSGTGYGDKEATDTTQDLKDMLDWCKAGTTKQIDIAAGNETGDLTISSTGVFLQDVSFAKATNAVIEYTFTMKITNATFGTVS